MSGSVTVMFQCSVHLLRCALACECLSLVPKDFRNAQNTVLSATTFNNAFVTSCHSAPSKGLKLHDLCLLDLLRVDGQPARICYNCPGMVMTPVIILSGESLGAITSPHSC